MKKLGSGSYGNVYKVKTKYGKHHALKASIKPETYSIGLNDLREVDISLRLRHPYVNQILDYTANYVVSDKESKYTLIYPLADGTLFDLADKINKLKSSEHIFMKYLLQLLLGLKYVHDRDIILSDIKPENVLYFDKEDAVKFNDFGSSVYDDKIFKDNITATIFYMSPEVLFQTGMINKSSDVWSLGMMFVEILTGELPQDFVSDELYYNLTEQKINKSKAKLEKNIKNALKLIRNRDLSSMIENMLQIDYTKRLTVDQLLQLPIFSDYKENEKIIEKLYTGCPITLLYSNTHDFTKNIEANKVLTLLYKKCSNEGQYWSWFNTVDILNYLVNVNFIENDFVYPIIAAFLLCLKLYSDIYYEKDNINKFLSCFNINYKTLESTEVKIFTKLAGKIYRKNIYSFLYNSDVKFDTDKLSKFVISTVFEGEIQEYVQAFLEYSKK